MSLPRDILYVTKKKNVLFYNSIMIILRVQSLYFSGQLFLIVKKKPSALKG